MSPTDQARPVAPSASRLLILNAVFPGLGHLVAGRRLWALGLALPVLVLVGIGVVAFLGSSATSAAARMFDPTVLAALLGIQGLFLLWRLFALGAVRVITPIRPAGATLAALVVAILIVVAPQLVVANLTLDAHDAAAEVFQPVDEGGAWVPDESAPPVASNDPDFVVDPSPTDSATPSGSASASPAATATPGVPRVNVLLLGMDSASAATRRSRTR